MEKLIGEKQKDMMLSSSVLIGSQEAMSHPLCFKVIGFEPHPLLGQVYVYTHRLDR